ncbi:tetratricopeptide repeat protein [Devosia sp.]|uniref:tetratricopeptide repeat protein n=1 Tax=Devosia sp. TaxID=1871048 RepID=UPI003BA9832C
MTQTARLLTGAILALTLSTSVVMALDSSEAMPLSTISATGNFLAGRQALQDLRTGDAAELFNAAAQADWDNPVTVERSFMAFAANGQIEDAARVATHLIELTGPNDMASLVIGTEALKQRRYAAAAKALEKAGGDTFAGVTGGIIRAWALSAEGQDAESSKLLDTLGQGGLEDFLVFHRALMADVAGRSSEALDFAKKAYEGDPNVVRVVEAYTRMLGNAGRFDEAEAVIAKFDATGLDHPLIDAVKASIDLKQRPGVFATNVQAGAAEVFNSMGVALGRESAPEITAVFLQLGMYLDPNADAIDLVYGQLLDEAGQHDEANDVYNHIASTSVMKPMAVVRVAENLAALGDRDKALTQLASIVSSSPKDVDALSVLGDMQRAAEKFDDAADSYSKALAIVGGESPADWRFYYVRGISYERGKHWDKAEADFKKALVLNPDQPQVLNYLGYSWVDKGINLIPALDMIQKAVDASPNDGYIVDSLGWAYYRLGRFAEAVTTLEKAVQMRSTDPEINDHLGDAYWRAGRELEARFQWNIASAVDEPDGAVRARVKLKLAGGLDAVPQPGTVAESAPQTETAPAAPPDATTPN